MLKVGIVTFHFVNNFGGALQAYALQKTIADECKVRTEIVNYRNGFIRLTDAIRLLPITSNWAVIKSGMLTMRQRFGRISKFSQFMSESTKLSKPYYSSWELRKTPPDFDKYVCGSDQIWNPYITLGVNDAYFLGFVKSEKQKIAYAPSFGTSRMGERFERRMKKYLFEFGSISVRESEGVEFVKRLSGREAIQLIDPALLLSKEEYSQIAVKPQIEGKYILLYIMQQDDEMYSYVEKLKERLGLKVVDISRYGYKPKFIDESLIDVGPREFVGLFQNAEYVCTNSYHGFVFSIIFEKQFCLIPCKRFRLRIENLGKLLKINLPNLNDMHELQDTIYDFTSVKAIIRDEREKSINYLRRNLLDNIDGEDTV